MDVNEKRVLRICRAKSIQSTIKHANHGCTRHAPNPQYIAENILNRQFHADKPNEKWLTDVTEFKYYVGMEVHKVYLSAILDLYDRRIVSFVIRNSNDLPLVFDTLDAAVKAYPNAHPLFHSDRGFQYTHRGFHRKLEKYGMKQSMSRVGKCIDNGPMEGFWGILKRERYYARRFTSRDELFLIATKLIIHATMTKATFRFFLERIHITIAIQVAIPAAKSRSSIIPSETAVITIEKHNSIGKISNPYKEKKRFAVPVLFIFFLFLHLSYIPARPSPQGKYPAGQM